jgi:hypothetical protein
MYATWPNGRIRPIQARSHEAPAANPPQKQPKNEGQNQDQSRLMKVNEG